LLLFLFWWLAVFLNVYRILLLIVYHQFFGWIRLGTGGNILGLGLYILSSTLDEFAEFSIGLTSIGSLESDLGLVSPISRVLLFLREHFFVSVCWITSNWLCFLLFIYF
jgi:hypothetical protein